MQWQHPRMPARIEDYALIGDCETAALVSRDGSIDWLCWPRFDSHACFAALLGGPDHGRWLLAPADASAKVARRYRDSTMILETTFETIDGAVMVVDFMPLRDGESNVVRTVVGLRGSVAMRTQIILRFGYGSIVPWVSRARGRNAPRDRRARHDHHQVPGPSARRRPHHGRRFHCFRGRAGVVRHDLGTVAPRAAQAGRSRPRARRSPSASGRRGPPSASTPESGAMRSSDPSSRSRRSPTRRPAESSPLRRRRCPSRSAACATGTTATAGCATRR